MAYLLYIGFVFGISFYSGMPKAGIVKKYASHCQTFIQRSALTAQPGSFYEKIDLSLVIAAFASL
ncbi:MAG: hypothetical protein H6575_09850 [Lewinellaceae bacterium]|nr:hypothetical protein [Lewinellaceae bacterium]